MRVEPVDGVGAGGSVAYVRRPGRLEGGVGGVRGLEAGAPAAGAGAVSAAGLGGAFRPGISAPPIRVRVFDPYCRGLLVNVTA